MNIDHLPVTIQRENRPNRPVIIYCTNSSFIICLKVNDCMRIKTLGDCYCCVSGMPVSRPNHAENVVKTGLQMVTAIKYVLLIWLICLSASCRVCCRVIHEHHCYITTVILKPSPIYQSQDPVDISYYWAWDQKKNESAAVGTIDTDTISMSSVDTLVPMLSIFHL